MVDGVPHGRQCTATAKATGQRCKRLAVDGYNVCQVHGAGSPHKGRPGGRPIVHGRYSKHLPERLAGKFQDAMRDPNLLDLRSEVALLDIRIGELVEALGGDVPDHESWSAIVGLLESRRKLVDSEHKRMVAMQQTITAEKALVLLAAVVDVIRRHVTDRETLASISHDIRALTVIEHSE